MKVGYKKKEEKVYILLRRMRESADLTMREVGAMIGVSHVTISQFENGKLDLPEYRIEQLVKAYGLKMDDFNKIIGREPIGNLKDDCRAMLDRLDNEQLAALRSILTQFLRSPVIQDVAV
ncbi:MAG: helix-turn-helix domain-containing protein [Bdellovibrio sp.]|nr:helix-turn-helix domain-containing protein [Bdellovibrio sp.]